MSFTPQVNRLRPIAERKGVPQAHTRSPQSQDWWAAFDESADAILVTDAEGRLCYMNPVAQRAWAMTEHDVLGRCVELLLAPLSQGEIFDEMMRALRTGSKWSGMISTNDAGRWHVTVTPVDSPVHSCSWRVIRMQLPIPSVRPMSGGHDLRAATFQSLMAHVAHDLNNTMTVLQGNIDLTRELAPEDSSSTACLEEIRRATACAGELATALMTFVEPSSARRTKFSMETLVRNVSRTLGRTAPANVRFEVGAGNGMDCHITGDHHQLHFLLTRIGVEFCHGPSAGGNVFITTHVRTLTCPLAEDSSAESLCRFGVVAMSTAPLRLLSPRSDRDQACGPTPAGHPGFRPHAACWIEPELQRVLQEHRAWIETHQEADGVRSFELWIPLCEASRCPAETRRRRSTPGPGAPGPILLYEPDPFGAALFRGYAESNGYSLILVTQAEQIRPVLERQQPLAGIILIDRGDEDFVELLEGLRSIGDHTPRIIASARTRSSSNDNGQGPTNPSKLHHHLNAIERHIPSPYSPEDLLSAINDLRRS